MEVEASKKLKEFNRSSHDEMAVWRHLPFDPAIVYISQQVFYRLQFGKDACALCYYLFFRSVSTVHILNEQGKQTIRKDLLQGRSGELRSYGSVRGMGPLSPLKRVEANKGTWYAKEAQEQARSGSHFKKSNCSLDDELAVLKG